VLVLAIILASANLFFVVLRIAVDVGDGIDRACLPPNSVS
jgi:hypothetical protein